MSLHDNPAVRRWLGDASKVIRAEVLSNRAKVRAELIAKGFPAWSVDDTLDLIAAGAVTLRLRDDPPA